MSILSEKIFNLLREVFPFAKIIKEYSIVHNNQRLFVDFYLPSYLLAVEVHGTQHDKFVKHFHGDAAGWRAHKYRDRVKCEWADLNGVTYVVIREENMIVTKEDLLNLIRSCSHDG